VDENPARLRCARRLVFRLLFQRQHALGKKPEWALKVGLETANRVSLRTMRGCRSMEYRIGRRAPLHPYLQPLSGLPKSCGRNHWIFREGLM
jgi:hypothetical protein